MQLGFFSPCGQAPALWLGVHKHREEMGGCVLPAGLLAPHGFATGAKAHKHGLLLVPPLGRCVRVVLVLLDPLCQLAICAKLFLQGTNNKRRVSMN